MKPSDTPFAEKKFKTVNGQRMAHIDEGEEPTKARGVRLMP